jgi:GTP-binding protein YchF
MTCVGFFGLPGCGKTTVFRALTCQAVAPQYLSYDLKPHQAVVKIPDKRLDKLAEVVKPRDKVINATVEFVDIPGFDPAGTETKLKNAVLEHYRRVDALALTVNLWDPAVARTAASGIRSLLEELVLLDLVSVERTAKSIAKAAQVESDQEVAARYDLLTRLESMLESGTPVRRMGLTFAELKGVSDLGLLSAKQMLAVLNVAEDDFAKAAMEIGGLPEVLELADAEQLPAVRFSAALEAELATLSDAEATEYMEEFGITEAALPRFVRAAHEALGLITFLTFTDKECRAWSLGRGMNAQQAAGVIHSDMARGFIRAETIAFETFVEYEDMAAAKASGKVRLEGKEYVVQDGDILRIRFNV